LQGRQNSTPASISPPAIEQLASTKKFQNLRSIGVWVGVNQSVTIIFLIVLVKGAAKFKSATPNLEYSKIIQ
jgi:hypothetical protein